MTSAHYYRSFATLAGLAISCLDVYTATRGLWQISNPVTTLGAIVTVATSTISVLLLVGASLLLGRDLSAALKRRLKIISFPMTLKVLIFSFAWYITAFLSFVCFYEILAKEDMQSHDLFRLSVEGLHSRSPEAILAAALALSQTALLILLRLIVAVRSDGQTSLFSAQPSVQQPEQDRQHSGASLVGNIANEIRRRKMALVGLAGLTCVYCIFMFKDASILSGLLLGCMAWGGIEVIFMSRRLSSGCFGEADHELQELVAPLVARIKEGSDPGDPDRIFPDRVVEHGSELPSGLTAGSQWKSY